LAPRPDAHSSPGGLIASVVLKARADVAPYDYRTVIYTQFGVIAFSTLIFVFMPESPWWTARKGKLDRTRKILEYTHRGVRGYNVERELGIILHTIEVQRENDAATRAMGFTAVLRGLNGKRFLIGSYPKVSGRGRGRGNESVRGRDHVRRESHSGG
jgi:hypothetical protein